MVINRLQSENKMGNLNLLPLLDVIYSDVSEYVVVRTLYLPEVQFVSMSMRKFFMISSNGLTPNGNGVELMYSRAYESVCLSESVLWLFSETGNSKRPTINDLGFKRMLPLLFLINKNMIELH